MRRPQLLFLLLLLVFLTLDFAVAEDGNQADEQNGNDDANNMDDNVQGDDAQAEQDQGDDNVQYDDDGNQNMGDDGAQDEQDDGQGDDDVQQEDGDDNVQGDDDAQNMNNEDAQDGGDDYAQDEDAQDMDDDAVQNGDGNSYGQNDAYGNGNDNYNWNGQDQGGNETDDGSSQNGGNYRSKNVVCSDAVIQVKDIVVYCDSPGTFYYGSGKYRNSQTCQPGDKARVQINFYIADHDMIQQAGNYALVDVYADGGYYTDSVTVYDSADLCSLSSLKKTSGNQCPYNGYYKIKTHFYWGSSDNVNESFEPVIHIGFKSNLKKQVYDFGGANTNLCRGSTFLTWSDGVRVSYANAVGNFMKSFGILLLTVTVLGILAWFLSHRPKSFKDAKAKFFAQHKIPRGFGGFDGLKGFGGFGGFGKRAQTHRELSINMDEEFDFRKITTAGNRDLVDF